MEIILKTNSEIVIITGGEPLIHNLDELTSEIKKYKKVHLETSGAYKLSGEWDWITLSPKKNKLPFSEVYNKANELKCVIHNKSDFKFALEQSKKVSRKCSLYLQPEWSKKDEIIEDVINFIKINRQFKLSIQTHKYLGLQ